MASLLERAHSSLSASALSFGITKKPEPPPEPELFDNLCPKMTFQQRLVGFAVCLSVAYMITFMSFKFFIKLIEGSPVPFVLNYTVGNILALLASMFLCGPRRQFKYMMDEKRKTTAIVYVSCLLLTIIVVFLPIEQVIKLTLLLLFIFIQICAQVWYTLSYIPLGRRTAKKAFRNIFGLDEWNSVDSYDTGTG